MDDCSTTIVVVPRETHSSWVEMLDTLHAGTDAPYRLIVVDGASPPKVRRTLERLARERDFTLLRSDGLLSGNEARNIALPHVHTEFVAYLDNDTLVPPGWLPPLEQCARETGAQVVSPTVLLGHDDKWEIHFAGGTSAIVGEGSERRYEERNILIHHPVSEMHTVTRSPTEYLELHCALIRTSLFSEIGPFDEGLIAARDHADLGLKVAEAGATTWLEPAVTIRYTWPKRLHPSDYLFYLPRWSEQWSRRSYDRFNEEWQLHDTAIDDQFVRGHLERRLGGPPRPKDPRRVPLWKVGRHVRRGLDLALTPIAVRAADHRRAHCGPPRALHTATWDSG